MKQRIIFGIIAAFMAAQAVYAISPVTKPYTFVSGTKAEAAKVNANDDAIVTGVNAAIGGLNQAAGTKATLDTRLDIALNEDGTFKNISGVTAGSQWLNPAFTFNYSSATKFNVTGDQTDIYLTYRRLKANLAASTAYSEVVSSAYNAGTGKTYITIADAVLTSPITSIEHSIITPVGSSNSAVSARVSTGYPLASANTASSIVLRDASGDFSAGTITAALTGTASNSSALNNQAASFYQNADNLNAGTVALARIPATLTGKDADTVDTFHASQTPGANQIPVLTAAKLLQIDGGSIYPIFVADGSTLPGSYPQGLSFSSAVAESSWPENNGSVLTWWASNNVFQLFSSKDSDNLYLRTKSAASNAWLPWVKLWHSGNDGAGSTLDADLLDGQSSAYYQPASTAITTSNIGSQSVAYATTATDSAATGSIPYARYEDGLRIVRGSIAANGSITVGSGFSCVKNSTGNYTITYTNAFSAQPTVTVSQNTSTGAGSVNQGSATPTTTLDVNVYDSTPALADRAFTFIAIGPN